MLVFLRKKTHVTVGVNVIELMHVVETD